MSENLYTLIRSSIADPAKIFIETGDGRTFSYADTFALAERFAGLLVGLGVQPGDRVAVQVDKSAEALIFYLGVVAAGGVYLPLNVGYTLTELEYFIGDAEPRVVVCRPNAEKDLGPLATRLGVAHVLTLGGNGDGSLMEKAKSVPAGFAAVPRAADDLAAILYTSGTTGRSKGAMLTHHNLYSNAATLKDYWRFTRDDVLLHALPIFHTHGLFVASNVTLLAGASMIFLSKFDGDEVMKLLPRATSMMGVPTFYVRLLQSPALTKESVKHIRLFVSGSAPLLADTHKEWEARTGHRILERYGMTETNMNTSNPYDAERVAGTVGFPLPGVSVRITDPETGKPLAQGEIGMIEVKGPNVFKGYWRMPEKTAAEFRADGFFITGDLGKIDDRGYVHIVGRGKDLIITGGYNVYPKEVETEIDAMPGVIESAVIGVDHPDFGEGVTAVVVASKGHALDEAGVLKALDGRLAKFKLPKRVFFVDDLPRNTMGKVQKNLLRDQYKTLYKK
ncbi:malonyl-CoA synthase [Ferrovibrio terrae]|uniref:Malonyl-CoA synthase n=1 Tax=Ferrovibrio terrae TaxID=2594003 RepID=A0A516GWK3_9PROT|nr:malonyl-CoA synthase [Ferrovibrio terrae]QDO95889.1 malonyl-CoA synthase [Ferrovibrio terrae]